MKETEPLKGPRFLTGIGLLALPVLPAGGTPTTPIKLLKNVWIEISDGMVVRIGQEGEPLPISARSDECYSAESKAATPGFVESHTHPAFVQYRQNEFILRCQGKSYLDIAAAGGGILSSVRGVRETGDARLAELIRKRFVRFLELGVTTVEAKSGYGLSLESELRSLRAIKTAAGELIEVSPTLLGAHTVPPEFKGRTNDYVELVCKEMIPAAAEQRLAEAVDVFVEETAFDLKAAEVIFRTAREHGLGLRIHADQFHSGGGANLAAEYGAWSADHMDRTDDEGIKRLADARVTVVMLPGAVFFLGLDRYAPARKFIDAGCKVAVSTDFNPGTSPSQSLPLMMTLACNRLKMSPDEALWAVTMGAAGALKRETKVGSLLPGYQADICLWDIPDLDYLPYAYGDSVPRAVFKKGVLAAEYGILRDDYRLTDK